MASGTGRRSFQGTRGLDLRQPAQAVEGMGSAPGEDSAQRAEPTGCGWFESSRHLREGAEVCEHEVLDPIVNDLPLAWWIEWASLRAHVRRP